MRSAAASLLALAWFGAAPWMLPDAVGWPWVIAVPLSCGVAVGLVTQHGWTVPLFAVVVGLGGPLLFLQVDGRVHDNELEALGYLYVLLFAALCFAAGIVGLLIRLGVGAVRGTSAPDAAATSS